MSRNVVGKVTLKVSSLNEMTEFYSDVIGLEVDRKEDGKAWLSPKNDDPLLVLNERQDAPPRSRTEAGLYHLAIRVPDRGDLAHSLARIRAEGKSLTGASDHLVSEALYLSDPEGNGIEVYHDRPKGEWDHTQDGSVVMDTLPLDLNDILEEKGDETHPKMP
ncbi:MAG: VOC family protein, partial [Halobacteria archaeon]|nr:VOC family protein [Halobacteria archaeon]